MSGKLMKALVCRELGPIDDLSVGEVELPPPAAGEVRIAVHAAGVNFPDGLMVQGKYQTQPALPFIPGAEAAGVIEAVGADVTRFAPGDRVAAFTGSGAFAQYVNAPASQVYPLPVGVDLTVAAGLLITYGTSYHALKDRAALREGETLLVLGAAGGVGLAAVELGAMMGARVIAAASTPEKLELARRYGAAEVIDYAKDDLRERVKALTGGRGVDVVYDPVGGETTTAAVKSLAWGGRHLVVGFAAGDIPKIPANLLLLKSAASLGVLWGMSLRADPEPHARNIADLLDALAQGRIRPAIDTVMPLEQAADALNHVMERRARGKVILAVSEQAQEEPG